LSAKELAEKCSRYRVRRTARRGFAPCLPDTLVFETVFFLAVVVVFAVVFVDFACAFPPAEACAVPEDRRLVALDVVVASAPVLTIKPKTTRPITLTSFDTRRLLLKFRN
jgi:hypothetical protein